MDTCTQRSVVLAVLFATLFATLVNLLLLAVLAVNELQDSLCERVDFALAVLVNVLVKVVVRVHATLLRRVLGSGRRVGELTDGGDEDGRVADVVCELRVLCFKELHNGLEC